jgi:hypothetical protein
MHKVLVSAMMFVALFVVFVIEGIHKLIIKMVVFLDPCRTLLQLVLKIFFYFYIR